MIPESGLRTVLSNIKLLDAEDQIKLGVVLRAAVESDPPLKWRILSMIHEILAGSGSMRMVDFVVVLIAICEHEEVVGLLTGSSGGDDGGYVKPTGRPVIAAARSRRSSRLKTVLAVVILIAVGGAVAGWIALSGDSFPRYECRDCGREVDVEALRRQADELGPATPADPGSAVLSCPECASKGEVWRVSRCSACDAEYSEVMTVARMGDSRSLCPKCAAATLEARDPPTP